MPYRSVLPAAYRRRAVIPAAVLLLMAAGSGQVRATDQTSADASTPPATMVAQADAPAAAVAPAAPAASASAPARAAARQEEPIRLQQVVVSANKRIERLENVPMAITVLGAEQLERSNVRSLEDVITLSPALTITYGTTPANNGINMRGIGTSSIGIGVESDVAVVLDDIPLGAQFMAFQDLTDIARVEILKGPQSTLFGKSAIAGVVNIVTKPVGGPLHGEASALATSDGERRLRASYGGDLTDHVAFRIAASTNDFPGNVTDLSTGAKVNGSRGRTIMGKLVWRASDQLDFELSPRFNHTDSTCCVLVPTGFTPLQGALLSNVSNLPATSLLDGIPIGPNNRTVRNDAKTGLESDDTGVGFKINYSLPDGMLLTSITSAQHYTAADSRDQDFVDAHTLLYYPLANGQPAGVDQGYVQYGTYDIHSVGQEFRVTSPDEGAFRYVAGLWYGHNGIDRHFVRGYNGIALSTPVEYFATTANANTAIFGQATWQFRPDDTLLGGLRVNRQVSGYEMDLGNPPPGDFVPKNVFSSVGNSEVSTTGKLSWQHQFTRSLMAYVMGATGYKGQAYDITSGLNAATAAQQPVHSETGRTVELGLKGNFLDNRLTVNAAAFRSTFSNYQQNSGSYLPGTTTYVTRLNSIGGVQTHGIEADIAAMPIPALLLNASFAYTLATVTDWQNAPCYSVAGSPNGGFNAACVLADPNFGGQNVQGLSGARMPNAPRYKGSFSGQYDIGLNAMPFNLFTTATARYQSAVITNINQDPTLAAPGYIVADLGLGVKDKSDKYRLSFSVDNVFDKQYADTGFTGLGAWSAKAPNPPVTVTTTTWTPARDAFRYYALRFDAKY